MAGKKKRVHLTAEQVKEREFMKSRQKPITMVNPSPEAVREVMVNLGHQAQPTASVKSEDKPALPATSEKPATAPVSPDRSSVQLQESGVLLLTATELCALLKISRRTLIRMDKAGTIPGRITLGGSVRYHREKIERWLLEQCQ